jgi:hypothetical protein
MFKELQSQRKKAGSPSLRGQLQTLNHTFQIGWPLFLFWYVQYQYKEPELLLRGSSDPEMAAQVPRPVILRASAPLPEEILHVDADLAVYYYILSHSERSWGGEFTPEGFTVLGWRTPPDLPDLGAKVSGVHGLLSWEALVRDSIKLLFSRFALFSAQMSLLSSRSNCYMIDSSC